MPRLASRLRLARVSPWRRFSNRRALSTFLLALAAGALVLLGGCGDGDEPAPGSLLHASSEAASQRGAFEAAGGTRAAALQVLDSVEQSALRGAFGNLDALGYTRRVRTAQLGAEGRVEAFEERVARHAAGGGGLRVLRSDSSGAFDFGALGRFARGGGASAPASDLTRQVLAEEPAFLSERNRYAFQYRLLPDTSMAGGKAHVVAVRARPGSDGDKQTIRRARLYVDAATGQLVALQVRRVRRSLLFDEATHQHVRVRPLEAQRDSTVWVPAQTRFETEVRMPLRPTRRFRTEASYEQYRRRPSS